MPIALPGTALDRSSNSVDLHDVFGNCQRGRPLSPARLLQSVTFSLQIDECWREKHAQLMGLNDLVWSLADVALESAYFNPIFLGHALRD